MKMQERVRIPVKPFKKLPAFSEERQNVGVRNPYALADAVLGERQDWQGMGIDEKKNVLPIYLIKNQGKRFLLIALDDGVPSTERALEVETEDPVTIPEPPPPPTPPVETDEDDDIEEEEDENE
jgi:hypothetical protein